VPDGRHDTRASRQDMLDLAYGCTDTSRLGCQVKLATHMEGMVISIPSQANNLMDHIPFPDQ
jgi:ferredoxin